jgi:hypothetical protein
LVPVAASATTTAGGSVTLAAASSISVAATIGPRWPKSGESIVTSAATTIWRSFVAACAP